MPFIPGIHTRTVGWLKWVFHAFKITSRCSGWHLKENPNVTRSTPFLERTPLYSLWVNTNAHGTFQCAVCTLQQKIKLYFTAASKRLVTANYRKLSNTIRYSMGTIQMALTRNSVNSHVDSCHERLPQSHRDSRKVSHRGSQVPVCATRTEYRKHVKDMKNWLLDSFIPCAMNGF